MWYVHIRDLSPTAKAVRGAVCQGNELPWFAVANQEIKGRSHMSPLWCLSVMGWWWKVGWVGSPPYFIYTPYAETHLKTPERFLFLLSLALWLARCPLQPG